MSQPAKTSQSPFLDVTSFSAPEAETNQEHALPSAPLQSVSPFVSVYEMEDGEERVDPESEEFVQFVSELYDEEFDEAVFELVTEASELYDNQFVSKYRHPAEQAMEAERILEAHFSPLVGELEVLLETMADDIDRRDLEAMTETEIDAFIDHYAPSQPLSPAFENIFGWAKKKVKKALKKGIDWVKKKGKALAKKAFRFALKKLKKYIKPWIKKVITFAIKKLPKKYQPMAQILAKRLGFQKEIEDQRAFEGGEDTVGEIGQFQQEFDLMLANLLFSEDETEQELMLAEVISEDRQPAADPVGDLDYARERFIEGVLELEEGDDPTPLVENFIPAILPLVKLGIRFLGRPKLVNFLAKYVARLIKRFVGRKYVRPLSKAIVDAGLRLINLEATEEDAIRAAGAAVATTVEDTIQQVATLPDYVLDDEELLEGYVLEAFEQAATRNLPEVLPEEAYLKRPDLRETKGLRATWILQPLRGRKFYKKYSRILNAKLSPQKLRAVKTYGDIPLAEIMQEQLGLSSGKDIEAKVHLYEMLPGAMLPQISKNEQNTPGLGMTANYAYSQLHPLTPEAAGILLGQPGLGRTMSPEYLDNRRVTGIGQRFYYLEIPGARARMIPMAGANATMRRCSTVKIILDFARQQIRVCHFLSETKAQDIAVKLRRQIPLGVVMTSLSSGIESGLKHALTGGVCSHIKIIHEAMMPQNARGAALMEVPPSVKENLVMKLKEWLGKGLSHYFREQPQSFIIATEDPTDGVTLAITLDNLSGLPALRDALKRKTIDLRNIDFSEAMPEIRVQTIPGYYGE
ncbi:hypothetical protein [Nitrosococcus wardiae]|uniref:Uncharacterized protein n=1 Tax=Nitrosococcus wardiae TaxID=1814290 RepID=A0A4P7BZY0_9GAMM|nr:hypothetical protein [Nitrosococcus wardiae]QBQ54754.1 hypothetical protein E3U44_09705 [Nitrosococcus wardiae]